MARLPFVQVDTDFLTHGAAALAAILGPDVTPAVAGWAVLQLRTWALSRAEDEDSLGFIPGAYAPRLVATFAGWKGDPDAFLAALADPAVRLAEVTPEGVRLLGLARDAAALRKGRGDRERMSRRRSGDVDGKTQTQTQRKETTLSAGADLHPDDLQDAEELQQPALLQVASAPAPSPEALQALWNENAHKALPRWQGMSAARRKAAAARLRTRPDLEQWREVIARLSASPFCRGEERGSTWRASPDWILRVDTADKVLEGKYDRPAAVGPAGETKPTKFIVM